MGMFSKFWNTNARPEGWLGRFALQTATKGDYTINFRIQKPGAFGR